MTATTEAPASAEPEPIVITEPGVYDIPAEVYHADPVPGGSLSNSGAKKLLSPSCPARFKYELDNPPPPKRIFELGHAAHKEVLGSGPELVLVDRDRWDTKAVKEELAAIRARGGVPLKRGDWDMVRGMAEALRAHPWASALLAPDSGQPEQSLFWHDRGVMRRARLDWLRNRYAGHRLIVPDYKTCDSAAPDDLDRVIYNLGYHRAAAWYLAAVRALGLAEDPVFLLIFQEKTPPYLVTVAEPDRDARRLGEMENRAALEIYRQCRETGIWPGYAEDVVPVGLPPWVAAPTAREVW